MAMLKLRMDVVCTVLAVAVMSTGGCAVDPRPTGTAEQSLDVSGNYFGSRVAHSALTNAASAVSLSPFAYNDDTSAVSQNKVSIAYQEMAVIIGPTTLSGGTIVDVKAARFGARVLTAHTDAITNVVAADAVALFSGSGNGNLGTTTTPTGCSTTIGGTTFAAYVPDSMDPATETYRLVNGLSNQGVYTWCKGITVVYKSGGSLQADRIDPSTLSLTHPSLSGTCNTASDTPDVCIGKLVSATHKIAIASKLAKNANNDLPNLGGNADTDANVTSGTYAWSRDVRFVKDTSLSDMDSVWNRVRDGGAGQTAALNDLLASGASSP